MIVLEGKNPSYNRRNTVFNLKQVTEAFLVWSQHTVCFQRYINYPRIITNRLGRMHRAPYRGYGYIPLRFGGERHKKNGNTTTTSPTACHIHLIWGSESDSVTAMPTNFMSDLITVSDSFKDNQLKKEALQVINPNMKDTYSPLITAEQN